jgi:hypothetical protein
VRYAELADRALAQLDADSDDDGWDPSSALTHQTSQDGAGAGVEHPDEGNESARLGAIPTYPTCALPDPLRRFIQAGARSGLPAALLGGAALGAVAAAIGPGATLEAWPGWVERPILWVALLAPRGAGKSPSQERAFRPLRDHDAAVWKQYRAELNDYVNDGKDRGERTADPTVLSADATLEALARRLADGDGGLTLDLDELTQLLRGLGEYKRGGGGDRGRLLQLWSGAPWRYTRVGTAARSTNAVDLLIAQPTLVIVGGLQTALHALLGDEQDGLRPRWLPHVVGMPDQELPAHSDMTIDSEWATLLSRLLGQRVHARRWRLDANALAIFQAHQEAWKRQARADGETASTSAALIKADVHLLRVTLVLAEATQPGAGGLVDASLVERAAAIVDFSIDCWRALPESGGMALTHRDEVLDLGVARLADWLEQHGGWAPKSKILTSQVAGVKTAPDRDALLVRYKATYPGTVREVESTGGRRPVVVFAPPRRPRVPPTTSLGPKEVQELHPAPAPPFAEMESALTEPRISPETHPKEVPAKEVLPKEVDGHAGISCNGFDAPDPARRLPGGTNCLDCDRLLDPGERDAGHCRPGHQGCAGTDRADRASGTSRGGVQPSGNQEPES